MSSLSRRSFIHAAAIATAAGMFTGSRAMAANEKIRAAIIGCRNQGVVNAEAMLACGDFDIPVFCDCDTDMSAKAVDKLKDRLTPECRQEQDFRRVLEDPAVDAVVLAVPDHWHALMTTLALQAGKHVYVEKPASFNIGDGQAMDVAAAAHPNLTVQVGTMQRSGAHFKEAHDFVQGGGLGKVAFARAFILHDRGVLQAVPDTPPPATLDYDMWVGPARFRPYNPEKCHYKWRWARDFGTGEMGNWGAHWLDICLWYLGLGFPKSVTGLGGQYMTKDAKEWPDTQTVLYEYPELTMLWEQRLWIKTAAASDRFIRNGVILEGDKGSLAIDRAGWTILPEDGEAIRHEGSEMQQAHARNFAASIRGQEKPASNMREAHVCATLCHLANISTLTNRRLVFDADTQTIVGDAEAQVLASRPNRAPYTAG